MYALIPKYIPSNTETDILPKFPLKLIQNTSTKKKKVQSNQIQNPHEIHQKHVYSQVWFSWVVWNSSTWAWFYLYRQYNQPDVRLPTKYAFWLAESQVENCLTQVLVPRVSHGASYCTHLNMFFREYGEQLLSCHIDLHSWGVSRGFCPYGRDREKEEENKQRLPTEQTEVRKEKKKKKM